MLAGIGVDDIFVVVQEYSLTDPKRNIQDRMAEALRHGGSSMTTTTLTDFVAFMIGSSTQLPALASFCIWAAFAIAAVFIFSVTFFPACLVLDQQRQAHGRYDICCCCGSGEGHPESVYSFPETDPRRKEGGDKSGEAVSNPAEGNPPAAVRASASSPAASESKLPDSKDLPSPSAAAPKAADSAVNSSGVNMEEEDN